MSPQRPCLRCGSLIPSGSYCDAHQPVRQVAAGWRARPSSSSMDRPPPGLVAKIKQRDGHRCRACGSTDKLMVDHRLPVSRGGDHNETNLWTLCERCHGRKHRLNRRLT